MYLPTVEAMGGLIKLEIINQSIYHILYIIAEAERKLILTIKEVRQIG